MQVPSYENSFDEVGRYKSTEPFQSGMDQESFLANPLLYFSSGKHKEYRIPSSKGLMYQYFQHHLCHVLAKECFPR